MFLVKFHLSRWIIPRLRSPWAGNGIWLRDASERFYKLWVELSATESRCSFCFIISGTVGARIWIKGQIWRKRPPFEKKKGFSAQFQSFKAFQSKLSPLAFSRTRFPSPSEIHPRIHQTNGRNRPTEPRPRKPCTWPNLKNSIQKRVFAIHSNAIEDISGQTRNSKTVRTSSIESRSSRRGSQRPKTIRYFRKPNEQPTPFNSKITPE